MDGTYVNSQPDATFKLSTWAKALPAEVRLKYFVHAILVTTSLSSPLAYYDRALSWALAEALCYSGR